MKRKDKITAIVALLAFLLSLLIAGTDDFRNAKEVEKLEIARKK